MKDDDERPDPPDLSRWAEDTDEGAPLPDGFPERPDLAKVKALRAKLRADKASRPDPHRTRLHDRLGKDGGRAVRDIGNYTLIPMMMVVGPVMGYLVGHWAEGRFGGEPWFGVGGIVFGLAAAVRQIVIMLGRKSDPSQE